MSLAEKIYDIVKELPEDKQSEVIDFIEFLKSKEDKEDDLIIQKVIKDNSEALKELAK